MAPSADRETAKNNYTRDCCTRILRTASRYHKRTGEIEGEVKVKVENEHSRADEDRSRAREHTGRGLAWGEHADQPGCQWQGGQWQSHILLRGHEDFVNKEEGRMGISKKKRKLISHRSASLPSPSSSPRPISWQCMKRASKGTLARITPRSSRRRRNCYRRISNGTSLEDCRPVRPSFPSLHFNSWHDSEEFRYHVHIYHVAKITVPLFSTAEY